MENKDREHMRFLAACFALIGGSTAANAVRLADELLKELESNKVAGGIVDIVPKKKRSK
jgi:DNA-directed RNA polymerase subunit F